jgi:Fic family protein
MPAEAKSYEYESTHPWLKFKLDLRTAVPSLWIDLGEAASKCEHIAGVALTPEIRDELLMIYMAKGAHATTAIEGNTLTENQVIELYEKKLTLPPSLEYLAQEVDNVIDAANKVMDDMVGGKSDELAVSKITSYNKLILRDLQLEAHVIPGVIRNNSVVVGNRYKGAPWHECEYLLDRFCKWMNGPDFKDSRLPSTVLGIIKAIVAHVYLAWIHPFGDGNGRTARLLELQILLAARVPAPACQLLSNHYNQTRNMYYTKLNEASKNGGDLVPFISYAVKGYVDQLRMQIEKIQELQLSLAWQTYVDSQFHGKNNTTTEDRRRQLAMDLPDTKEGIAISKIRELTTHLAAAYANKTNRAIKRDLIALQEMELVEFIDRSSLVRAKTEIIQAFMPSRRAEQMPHKRRKSRTS